MKSQVNVNTYAESVQTPSVAPISEPARDLGDTSISAARKRTGRERMDIAVAGDR